MRVAPSDHLAAHAFCWKLERADGAGLALTSHDEPIMFNDTLHDPAPGMTPAAIRREMGLGGQGSEIAGAIASNAISETDIELGRWDGAAIRLSAVDWSGEELPSELVRGELGRIERNGNEFQVDLLGSVAKLNGPICPATSPECRAELGDRRCRVDMAGRRLRAQVVLHEGASLDVEGPVDNRFDFGFVRFLSGPLNGLSVKILAVDGSRLILLNALPAAAAAGTAVEIVEGCDKRLDTCSGRFGNAENFRGEPHLPGNDILTRYPGN